MWSCDHRLFFSLWLDKIRHVASVQPDAPRVSGGTEMSFLPRRKDEDENRIDLRLSSSIEDLPKDMRKAAQRHKDIETVRGNVLRERVNQLEGTAYRALHANAGVAQAAVLVAENFPAAAGGSAKILHYVELGLGKIMSEQSQ